VRANGTTKLCVTCGAQFYVPGHRVLTAKYCSTECHNHLSWATARHKRICLTCEAEFTVSSSRERSKYCSLECRSNSPARLTLRERRKRIKAAQIKLRGRNASRDLKRFLSALVPAVCGICGYDEYDFCLDVHHLDGNADNNESENLAFICCMCHRKLHKGVVSWPQQQAVAMAINMQKEGRLRPGGVYVRAKK